ncbi:MAG: SDR family oxidoreductase [Acutalibacteraceae bacterium]|nr:SDR family oxidoreductase [Acutalibacteraceae bacterium]
MIMNKVALITGASKGIGAATAIMFAQNGYDVIINYCSSAESAILLEKSLKENGFSALSYMADVSKSNDVKRMVNDVIERYGKIDVLINNAGVAQQKLFTDITDEDWERMVSINLTGTFNCCRAVIPHMVSRKSGSIINTSSIWGMTGASCEVHYSAVKAGIIGMTKALAKELGPSGIRVNCVAPGVINTRMNANLSVSDLEGLADETPLGRLGTTNEVASTSLFLASNAAEFITGQVISPNGGFVI